MAVLALVLLLCDALGYLQNLVVLTVTLCNVIGHGGFIFYLSHMLYNADHCEVN